MTGPHGGGPGTIDDLVDRITQGTRLDAAQARLVLGSALVFIRAHADPVKVRRLCEALPGVEALAAETPAGPAGAGGALASIMRTLGGVYGSTLADAMAMGRQLNAQGISNGQLKKLLPLTLECVRTQTGGDLMREVVESIPGAGVLMSALESDRGRNQAG